MRKYLLIITLSMLLASCSSEPNNNINDSLHTDLSAREAEKQGYVVTGPSGIANVGEIEKFYEDFQNKKSSSVTLARYTDEGDPIYIDLKYNGEDILYTYDNTWDEFGGQNKGVRKTSCTQLGKRTGSVDRKGTEYYLVSCRDDVGFSNPDKKEYFLLFIDDKNTKSDF